MPYSERFSEIELFQFTVYCTLYRRATRHVLTRVAKCVDVEGGILENVLHYVNCTTYVTWKINTGISNSTKYLFLTNSFGNVQRNSSISETEIGHVLRMTDTVTSQNIDISSWDILYISVTIYKRRSCDEIYAIRMRKIMHGSLGFTFRYSMMFHFLWRTGGLQRHGQTYRNE
jgi:hypothetical protein